MYSFCEIIWTICRVQAVAPSSCTESGRKTVTNTNGQIKSIIGLRSRPRYLYPKVNGQCWKRGSVPSIFLTYDIKNYYLSFVITFIFDILRPIAFIHSFIHECHSVSLAWAWLAKAKGHSCHTKNQLLPKPFAEKHE